MKRNVAILGSTGSIGTQALEVISSYPDMFEVFAITANNQVDLLIQQARAFMPDTVVIANKEKYPELKEALKDLPIKVWAGAEAIEQVVQTAPIDIVLTAMVGFSGLKPTIQAIKAKKTIALANKETLVVAGDLISRLALENKTPILPVDSEHSAIFQCLTGERNPIEKIWLTASGGPFRKYSREDLLHVGPKDALKHPNWSMGAKITIDSSTMMNKGFEMIEACWLFDVKPEQIQVVVHPQSIIHSMVQFQDSSVKAQLGLPDMRLPIQYALTYPERIVNDYKRLEITDLARLTFETPDMDRFPNLQFAYQAIAQGGNMPCILNAANEIVVEAFLKEQIGFVQMSRIIEKTMQTTGFIAQPAYDDYIQTDDESRQIAKGFIHNI